MDVKKVRISFPVIKYETWDLYYRNFGEDSNAGEELAKLYPERKDD